MVPEAGFESKLRLNFFGGITQDRLRKTDKASGVRGVPDRFVAYFLFGEYFAAMVPISIIAILEPQTLGPIIIILVINIVLLVTLGVLPKYFRRN